MDSITEVRAHLACAAARLPESSRHTPYAARPGLASPLRRRPLSFPGPSASVKASRKRRGPPSGFLTREREVY